MERDFNNNNFIPPYMDFMSQNMSQNMSTNIGNNNPNCQPDYNEIFKDPFLNPMFQYEQACSYYRYLCLQMDYKIKCKEYEKMCSNTSSDGKRERRPE